MPLSVVSIGVALGQNMEIGVVYNPFNKELFYARRGQGICTIAMLMNRGEVHCQNVFVALCAC